MTNQVQDVSRTYNEGGYPLYIYSKSAVFYLVDLTLETVLRDGRELGYPEDAGRFARCKYRQVRNKEKNADLLAILRKIESAKLNCRSEQLASNRRSLALMLEDLIPATLGISALRFYGVTNDQRDGRDHDAR